MKKGIKKIVKAIGWSTGTVVALAVLAVVALYLPFVQDFAVPRVLSAINKPGEMEIKVERLRLRFPLSLHVDSLSMLTPDMEVAVGRADLSAAVLPLLKGEIKVEDADISGTRFRLGTPDSALYMTAALELATLRDARVHLSKQQIEIKTFDLDSGVVAMKMRPDTVVKPKTDTIPAFWHITLEKGTLSRLDYSMELYPTITDLGCYLANGVINGADVDMRTNTVTVNEIDIQSVDAVYRYPSAEFLAEHPVPKVPEDTTATLPWTVRCNRVRLADSQALYALDGARPAGPNFDLDYIQASEINITLDSLTNRATTLLIPRLDISARERCGIPLHLTGAFDMDSVRLGVDDLLLTTATSRISLTGAMGLPSPDAPADAMERMPFNVDLNGDISNDDLRRLAPQEIAPIVDGLPRGVPLLLTAVASGTMADMRIENVTLDLPRHLRIHADGALADISDINSAVGSINLEGEMPDGQFLKPTLMDAKLARTVNLPPLAISGGANLNRGDISGDVKVIAPGGDIALDASWQNRVEGYKVDFVSTSFPLQKIMPSLGVSNISADVALEGKGIDPFSAKTDATARIDLRNVGYHGVTYKNIKADLLLQAGVADITAQSLNPGADFTLRANGNLDGDTLRWSFAGDLRDINLQTLALSDSVGNGAVRLNGAAAVVLPRAYTVREGRRRVTRHTPMYVDANMDIPSLVWNMAAGTINVRDLAAEFFTDSTSTAVDVDNGDLCLRAAFGVGLDSLLARVTNAQAFLDQCMKNKRRLAVDTLQALLPPMQVALHAGANNILGQYLAESKLYFDSLSLTAVNDSLITLDGFITGIESGSTRVDSIGLDMYQRGNTLLYSVKMENQPGTFDQFAHVTARGYVNADNFSLIFHQMDIKEQTGFSFGSVVTMPQPGVFRLSFVPYHPIIGYKEWEINRDNFITYNLRNHHIDANLNLRNDQSSLRLFTDHNDADTTGSQERIHLQVADLQIQDFLTINPFAPPIKGNLSADLGVSILDKALDGDGTLSLNNLYYGRDRVGDFTLGLELTTNAAGTIRANTSLMVDGVKTITASGNLNDSTAANPFNLDFRMIHFPLAVVNPFLPRGTARLAGMLNGEMDITGDITAPVLNGWLQFDSTAINVDMLGSQLTFSDGRIPVENSLVTLDSFAIKAVNDNPLYINGTVDLSSLDNVGVDITANARNMQIVGSKRRKGQDVYGKAYLNIDASAKGNLARFLAVDANAKILAGTNVTYVIPDVQQAIAARSNAEMVKFVNFADTAAVEAADSLTQHTLAMLLNATLEIENGSTIAVDLNADGKNRAQIEANGRINYQSDPLGDERVTGRINLNQGYVRYSMPPVLSEKLFHIREGSYVIFNGPMLNPVLNLHAYDEIKANVNDDGNSRMVNFDVGLSVTGTLEAMNVAFDLTAPDDLTVTNELQGMSPDQRANQAMNMLLYGQYTGPGTKASTVGNPLYNFLEGQLNNLASSAVKGVDISFGIDQLDRTRDGVNSTAMSYSYQVSKSLFDDRFKIVVGGNYTTDADADENFSQNLISDISFEYLLNRTGTMYVRLFRHTGYESILEGEITQTGVGFVYKKKLRSLRDLFRWLSPRRKEDNGNEKE